MKAKFLFAYSPSWQYTDIYYEYRGYKYSVVKYNNGCLDEPLREQHKREQRKIDELIEEKSKPIEPVSNDVCEAFDKLYNYFETGIWEE